MLPHAASAAKKRRERRLRAMLRHERRSVAMALAEFTHHFSRGQRKARAGEEVENATLDGLRAQKTPPPRERPSCLSDPGPQRSDRTVRHSAGEAPSLLPPSLADAAADTVDHSSLAFFLKVALQLKKDEEEKEARKVEMEQVQAVKEQWRERRKVLKDEVMALLDLQSRSSLQERRLQELLDALDAHDASKPSSGSTGLLFLVVGVPVIFSDKFQQLFEFFVFLDRMVGHSCSAAETGTHSVLFAFLVQFLGKVVVPVLRNDRDMVRQCRIPCWCRSCRSSLVVDIPFVPQSQIPHGPANRKTIEVPQLQYVDR